MQEEITQTIKDALLRLSKENNIEEKNIRIRITKNEKLIYQIMNGSAIIGQTTLKDILQLSGGMLDTVKSMAVNKYLNTAMNNFSSECGDCFVSLLLFLKNNQQPSGYLFSEGKAVREVSLSEII